jgi:hypothetical protein
MSCPLNLSQLKFRCFGPDKLVSKTGCKSCIRAFVDNDDSYTVLECIGDIDCPLGYYFTLVPGRLTGHPLSNKAVCRKCHSECKTCYDNGNNNCDECNNYLSTRYNQCVSNCSSADEYLDHQTNVSNKFLLNCILIFYFFKRNVYHVILNVQVDAVEHQIMTVNTVKNFVYQMKWDLNSKKLKS